MDFLRSVFYRVIPYQTTITKPSSIIVEETNKKIDFEKFDKEVENKCRQNMFYKYK
jgi:hypothetical protein